MRRAELAEGDIAALQERAGGAPVRVFTDLRGDCTIRVGAQIFDELADAVAHVAALEATEGVAS